MAITDLAGAISGLRRPEYLVRSLISTQINPMKSLWNNNSTNGFPPPGAFDTTLNGVTLSNSSGVLAGSIPFFDPISGNTYLAGLRGSSGGAHIGGLYILADRLWHNGGYTITSTSAQNSTTPTFPARDAAGATSGDGVLLGVEVSATTGAGTPTITISYTNSGGTAGRTGTSFHATVASSAIGAFYPISLQAGDTGVKSVESLTLGSSWTSGTINLVAYRLLGMICCRKPSVTAYDDLFTCGFTRCYDGTVPFVLIQQQVAGAGASNVRVQFSQG